MPVVVLAVIALGVGGCGGHRGALTGSGPRTQPAPAGSQPPTLDLTPAGPARPLPTGFMGFNGEAITAPPGLWRDPGFVGAVSRLRPEALRLFGGTTANFWDWRAGTFVSASSTPAVPAALASARSQVSIRLSDWARLARAAGAVPVFDLNLVTSTLPDQIAMLRAASALGLPIHRVELGNELYLPRYRPRFRSGRDYGSEATRWIAAIKRAFPDAQVAAVGYTPVDVGARPANRRALRWNTQMLETLRGENAITFHPYFGSGLGPAQRPATPAAAATALGAPSRAMERLRRGGLASLPPGVGAWLTEWNLFDRRAAVHGTWAQGLEVALFSLGAAAEPRVTQADEHALVASGPFGALFSETNGLGFGAPPGARVARAGGFYLPTSQPPPTRPLGLSASGVAMKSVLAVLRDAGQVQALSSGSAGGPAGIVTTGSRGRTALLVNPGPGQVRVRLPRTGGPGRGPGSFVALWADPATPVAGEGSLHRASGPLAPRATLVLAPYSLVRVAL